MVDRTPRNDLAEQAVLGGLMLEGELVKTVRPFLSEVSFYSSKHQEIFGAITWLDDHGQPIDLLSVTDVLRKTGKLDDIGVLYITSLPNTIPTTENLDYYVQLVQDAENQRQTIRLGQELQILGRDGLMTPEERYTKANELLKAAMGSVRSKSRIVGAAEGVQSALTELGRAMTTKPGDVPGVPFPFVLPVLNGATGGQLPSEVSVVQARTGEGKSVFIGQCLEQAAKSRGHSLLCSNEMNHEHYWARILAGNAQVNSMVFRNGQVMPGDREKIFLAAKVFNDIPIWVSDKCYTMTDVRASAYELADRVADHGGIKWIGIDWLQLMHGTGRKYSNKTSELDEILQGLKELAAELNVPIMINSQPKVADYKSQLTAVSGRDSGMVGFFADNVISIEPWPEYEGLRVDDGWAAKITLTKVRSGSAKLPQEAWFDGPHAQFIAMDVWHQRQKPKWIPNGKTDQDETI